jgi:uncharacterized protein
MIGEKDLSALLRSMSPDLKQGSYVFCTVSSDKSEGLFKHRPLLIFQEKEGTTFILGKDAADKLRLPYESEWALITLGVHSSLEAVGFLAKITGALAESHISVNVVSAYHHDHLFVPVGQKARAMEILKRLALNQP